MKGIKKAIMHFEYVKRDAVAVLDSGFGTKPNECSIVYENRKLYAELAITALEKQIPKKPEYYGDGYSDGKLVYDYAKCPQCGNDNYEYEINNWGCKYCPDCGQALDWSEQE